MTRPFLQLMRITGATKKDVPSFLEPGGLYLYILTLMLVLLTNNMSRLLVSSCQQPLNADADLVYFQKYCTLPCEILTDHWIICRFRRIVGCWRLVLCINALPKTTWLHFYVCFGFSKWVEIERCFTAVSREIEMGWFYSYFNHNLQLFHNIEVTTTFSETPRISRSLV